MQPSQVSGLNSAIFGERNHYIHLSQFQNGLSDLPGTFQSAFCNKKCVRTNRLSCMRLEIFAFYCSCIFSFALAKLNKQVCQSLKSSKSNIRKTISVNFFSTLDNGHAGKATELCEFIYHQEWAIRGLKCLFRQTKMNIVFLHSIPCISVGKSHFF